MIFGKLLVILLDMPYAQYRNVLDSALTTAKHPRALRFALPKTVMRGISKTNTSILAYDPLRPFASIAEQLTDEALFLTVGQPLRFAEGWDIKLEFSYYRLPTERRLLSGTFWMDSRLSETVSNNTKHRRGQSANQVKRNPLKPSAYTEACLPALHSDGTSFVLSSGMPLVKLQKPVRTPLVHPFFCFGPVSFLKAEKLEVNCFSYIAHREDYQTYALHYCPLEWADSSKEVVLDRPAFTAESRLLHLFEQTLCIDYYSKTVDACVTNGYYHNLCKLTMKRPAFRFQNPKWPLYEYPPLCITAVTDYRQDTVDKTSLERGVMLLDSLTHLPMVVYTSGSSEATIRSITDKSEMFPDTKLRLLRCNGMSASEFMGYAKIILMLLAAEKRKEFSHFCWVDPNILPHPLHENTGLDFSALADDRIHIAAVNGHPDPSCVVVPLEKLIYLKNESLFWAKKQEKQSQDYSEETLWQHLYQTNPAAFAIHELPANGLLFLTTIEQGRLSKQYVSQLPQNSKSNPKWDLFLQKAKALWKGIIKKCTSK